MARVLALVLAGLLVAAPLRAQAPPLLTTDTTLPPTPCVVGATFVLAGGPSPGFYVCGVGTSGSLWVPLVAAVAVSGPALPATCIVGALFTLLPSGIVYVCTATNHWNQSDGEKVLTNLANNVLVPVLTVTIPNESVGGVIEVTISGSLGAGGAVGAHEATAGRTVLIGFTRVLNQTLDASIATAANALDARVVGATTITLTTQLGATSGVPTGPQTFTLLLRITRGGGASAAHSATVKYRLISDDGPSLTIQ